MSNRQTLDSERRHFLRALTAAGGATAVAAALPAAASGVAPEPAPAGPEKRRGYRETAHVRAYYESARI